MNKTLAFVFVLIAGAHAVAVAKPSASEPLAAASHQEPVTVLSQQLPAQGGQPIIVPSGYSSGGQHFSPAGIVAIAGEKPYGQPESTGIPPNYKPFGSWGLYIGGNPADGYYSNYYKGTGGESSVKPAGEKPESGKPLYAAPSGPYGYSGEYVPVGYSQVPPTGAEFEPSQAQPESYSASTKKSAFPSGQETKSDSQFKKESKGYSPVFEQRSSYAQRVYVYPPAPSSPAYPGYAYSSPVYAYASPAGAYASPAGAYASPAGAYASPAGQAGPQVAGAQQQVIPYPVPVGSHIMASQPGVEGAYYPYGVHAYTKYVVKPVVGEASYAPVSSIEKASSSGSSSSSSSSSFSGPQQSGVYSPSQFVYSKSYYVSPAGQQQQPHYSPYYSPYYYSGNYYGFPLGQLHYSNDGPYSPAHEVQPQPQQQGPVYQGAQFGPVGVKPVGVEEGLIKPDVSVEKKAKA